MSVNILNPHLSTTTSTSSSSSSSSSNNSTNSSTSSSSSSNSNSNSSSLSSPSIIINTSSNFYSNQNPASTDCKQQQQVPYHLIKTTSIVNSYNSGINNPSSSSLSCITSISNHNQPSGVNTSPINSNNHSNMNMNCVKLLVRNENSKSLTPNDLNTRINTNTSINYTPNETYLDKNDCKKLDNEMINEKKCADESSTQSSPQTNAQNTNTNNPNALELFINNVVCSYSTRCHLNLRRIAMEGMHVEYKKENGMVNMKLRKPHTTATIWSSGKITCAGAKSESDAYKAARRYCRLLQKMQFKVRLSNYRVVNVLATCAMPFHIDIIKLADAYSKECSYEPELHPGATFTIKDLKTTLKLFTTGSITLTAPSVDIAQAAVNRIYPILYEYKRSKSPSPPPEPTITSNPSLNVQHTSNQITSTSNQHANQTNSNLSSYTPSHNYNLNHHNLNHHHHHHPAASTNVYSSFDVYNNTISQYNQHTSSGLSNKQPFTNQINSVNLNSNSHLNQQQQHNHHNGMFMNNGGTGGLHNYNSSSLSSSSLILNDNSNQLNNSLLPQLSTSSSYSSSNSSTSASLQLSPNNLYSSSSYLLPTSSNLYTSSSSTSSSSQHAHTHSNQHNWYYDSLLENNDVDDFLP